MNTRALAVSLIGLSTLAHAGVIVVPLGTDAPPAQVGGIEVIPFPADARPVFQDVLTVADGFGRELTLNSPMSVRLIGMGWATWSHGYLGNVYYNNGQRDIRVTFPRGVKATSFYAEPGPFGLFEITIVASDGTTTAFDDQIVDGRSGAHGWGIYATGGSEITSIRIAADVDFSIGEFAISEPCPADLDVDGFVDFTDFLAFLSYFDAGDLRVDYTGDGFVDFADYLAFLNYYGNSCSQQ